MAAVLLPNNRVQVGTAIYPKSVVSLHLSRVGAYLKASLSAYGQEIESCSDDPAHPKFNVDIFTKTTPAEIAEIAQNQNIVRVTGLSELNTHVVQETTELIAITHTYTQAGHGFTAPCVAGWNGTTWVLADKDTTVDNKLVTATTANSFTITLQGKAKVNHGLGSTPGLVYLGDNGALTTLAPTTGQIIVAEILDSEYLFLNPEQRPFN